MTAAPGVPSRFVQAWLVPDEPGLAPTYGATTPAPVHLDGRAALLAAGPGVVGGEHAALRLGTTGAALQVVRLEAGQELALGPDTSPPGSLRHVFVTTGALLRFSLAEPLSAGDTLVVDGPEAQAAAKAKRKSGGAEAPKAAGGPDLRLQARQDMFWGYVHCHAKLQHLGV